MHNSHIEHLSLVVRKAFDFSFLHNAKALTSLRLVISATEFNFVQIENILKSSRRLKKITIVQDFLDNLDIAKFLTFYERLLMALTPNSELGLDFHLTENTEPPFFPNTDSALKELMKQMGIISKKYLAKELIINGIEIKDFVNGLMDYESLPITLFNTRIEIGG